MRGKKQRAAIAADWCRTKLHVFRSCGDLMEEIPALSSRSKLMWVLWWHEWAGFVLLCLLSTALLNENRPAPSLLFSSMGFSSVLRLESIHLPWSCAERLLSSADTSSVYYGLQQITWTAVIPQFSEDDGFLAKKPPLLLQGRDLGIKSSLCPWAGSLWVAGCISRTV